MSVLKKLIPSAVKDFAKTVIGVCLAPLGWKLAPRESVVLEGVWYDSPVDGVVSRHRPPSLDDSDFRNAIEHLRNEQAFLGLEEAARGETAMQRLYLAGQLARSAQSLEGDFVEFGTFRGATAYCMLSATSGKTAESAPGTTTGPKSIYLYDTFSGIPTTGMTEHEKDVGLAGAHSDTSVDLVKRNLSEHAARVQIRPGLIPESLQDDGPERIAMMHVDLNLAAPTIAALRWAVPKWTTGGICLLDDYLWDGYEDQRREVDAFFRAAGLTIVALPTGQGIVLNLPTP